jgi:predicted RNase H-like nuclease
LVEAERPDILIAAGFAGALTRYHTVGETITPGTVIDSHTGDRFGLPWGTGVLVSSPTVADDQAKKRLAEHYSADFVDMEGASVARIGQETGVPVCAVKTISDELGFAMPPLNTYVRQDGTLAIERFAAHVAVRPGQWPNLIQLARNSRRASSALCNVLERLMRNVSQLGSSQGLKEAMQDLRMPARAVN